MLQDVEMLLCLGLPGGFSYRRMRYIIACNDQSSPGGWKETDWGCRDAVAGRGGAAVFFASDCQCISLSFKESFES